MSAIAPSIYVTRIMHLRVLAERARKHQFRYSVFRFWLDVDRIDQTLRSLRLVGHNRFNLFGFYERDHGPRDGMSLRPWVENLLRNEGIERPTRIMLYCLPRVFGYEFNPLAMYCAYDAQDKLTGVVYQVRNTDGDLSPYVANIERDGLRHGSEKTFYVSPFIDGNQHYGFTLRPPSDAVSARKLTDAVLLKLALLKPLMSFKITIGIYFEAIRLRLKGAPFFKHPGNNGLYAGQTHHKDSGGMPTMPARQKEVREPS